MPFLNGRRPDIAEITQDDGYVSVSGLLRRSALQEAGIQDRDMELLDLLQCEEHGNGQHIRNIKFTHGLQLIIYDGVLRYPSAVSFLIYPTN